LHERARTRRRLAALAAFCAFWAALLVTIGFPVWLVVLGYLVLVVSLAAAVEGRRAVEALTPRLRTAGTHVARGSRAVAKRVEDVDLEPARAGAGRGARRAAQAGRTAAATGGRAAAALSARAAAVSRAAVAKAGAEAGALRGRVDEARSRQAARAEAVGLNERAAALRNEGELDGALEAAERALALVRGLGDRRAEALTLNGIGLTQARSGDEAGAVDSYETASAILIELGDEHGAGRVLANLGALHLDLGHEDEAKARWTDALERLEPGSPEHERTAAQLRRAS
jgi:tetratricopeptide (TPR) repeat protein